MPSYRTTARGIGILLLAWAFWATPEAHARTDGAGVPDRLLFPVVGEVSYEDDFGDPRGQGSHEGNDIMADWRAPIVAVEDGRVELWTTSWRAGCMLYLHGRSGTEYLYVHLNNDLTDGNDNKGGCVEGVAYAPGLGDGDKVRAGELIAFVGDSGDADGIHPHLHFELHPDGGAAVSPYKHLRRATRLLFPSAVEESAGRLVAELKLALYGTVLAVESDRLTLRLEWLRTSTGWRNRISRELVVAVPAGTSIQRATGDGRKEIGLGHVTAGERAVVWTAPVEPTLTAQAGEPGSLAAALVLFRGED